MTDERKLADIPAGLKLMLWTRSPGPKVAALAVVLPPFERGLHTELPGMGRLLTGSSYDHSLATVDLSVEDMEQLGNALIVAACEARAARGERTASITRMIEGAPHDD